MKPLILEFFIALTLAVTSCGVSDPDYRQYSDENAAKGNENETNVGDKSGNGGDQTCADKVIAAFGLIQTAVNNTCGNAGCHGDGTGGGLTLTPGDSASTEAALAAFVGGNANKLISKLSDGGSHSGGVQIPNTLSESAITSWQSAKACE